MTKLWHILDYAIALFFAFIGAHGLDLIKELREAPNLKAGLIGVGVIAGRAAWVYWRGK